MRVADLNHGGARFDRPFVVLAMPSAATVPGIGSFHHPSFFQRSEAFYPFGARRHFDSPIRSILLEPGRELMVVVLAVPEDRLQPRKPLGRDLREQLRSGRAIVEARSRDQHRDQQTERIGQQMPLPSLDFLAAVVAPLFPADLGRLHRLAVDAGRAGGRFAASCDADLRPQRVDQLLPRAVVAPLGEVVVDRALGEQVVRQHVPLATAAIDKQNRVDDLAQIALPRTPEAVRAIRRQQWRKKAPLFVREIRGISFARGCFEPHARALRGEGKNAQNLDEFTIYGNASILIASEMTAHDVVECDPQWPLASHSLRCAHDWVPHQREEHNVRRLTSRPARMGDYQVRALQD